MDRWGTQKGDSGGKKVGGWRGWTGEECIEATAHYLRPMERNIVSQDKSLSSHQWESYHF